jgi:hypothetical protein
LIHCSPVAGCSNEEQGAPNDNKSTSSNSKEDSDAPKDEQSSTPEAVQAGDVSEGMTTNAKEDTSSQQVSTVLADERAANEEGDPQSGYSSNDIVGCPGDYSYDEDTDTCFPSLDGGDLTFIPVITGDKPLPDSTGGYVGLLGGVVGDTFQGLGAIVQVELGTWAEDALLWYGEDGGLIGYGIQGLGYTIGFAGDVTGGLLEGAGQVVNGVAGGTGEVIDAVGGAVGDAAEAVGNAVGDVVDDIGSWFGW